MNKCATSSGLKVLWAGHQLLNRRELLGHTANGLGGIALLALLQEAAAAGKTPIRPHIIAEAPLAPRRPHRAARAKRVLHVFCSGACSHLDTWDYKPELIKRHNTPMPGSDKLITFQGKSGNLIKSHWEFKPRGQSTNGA